MRAEGGLLQPCKHAAAADAATVDTASARASPPLSARQKQKRISGRIQHGDSIHPEDGFRDSARGNFGGIIHADSTRRALQRKGGAEEGVTLRRCLSLLLFLFLFLGGSGAATTAFVARVDG